MTEKKQEPNYKAFIPVGITFIGAGVVLMIAVGVPIGLGLVSVGIAFLAIGINKTRG
jgi:hypothetical protein